MLGGLPHIGDPAAPVKVLVASDFQCPVCKRAAAPVEAVARRLGKEAVVFFVHNPLAMHSRSMPAALAAEAAHRQGRFWEMHDKIFQNQRLLSDSDLRGHAEALGLDMARYDADIRDPALQAWIKRQQAVVVALGARGTPSFFVNGKKSVGWGSEMGFEGQIRREIKAVEPLVAQGLDPQSIYVQRVRANSEDPETYLKAFGR